MSWASAWNCIGLVPATHRVRVQGGRALYEEVSYRDDTPGEQVRLARLDATTDGLKQVNRWVDADTPLELVRDDGSVEPDPEALLRGALGC
jgi:hypothetical protein